MRATVHLDPAGWARAGLGEADGPRRTSLEHALRWARAHAHEVVVHGPDGAAHSAGAEPVAGLPPWSAATYAPSDWPEVPEPRADGWEVTLLAAPGRPPDRTPEAAIAAALPGGVAHRDPHALRFTFRLGPGARDDRTPEIAPLVAAALAPHGITAQRLDHVAPVGAVDRPGPRVALAEARWTPQGERWSVRCEDRRGGDGPRHASLDACVAWGRAHADVVLVRRGGPAVLPDSPALAFQAPPAAPDPRLPVGAAGWRVWVAGSPRDDDALAAKLEHFTQAEVDDGRVVVAVDVAEHDLGLATDEALERFATAGDRPGATWFVGVEHQEPFYATPCMWRCAVEVLDEAGAEPLLDALGTAGVEATAGPGRWCHAVVLVDATSGREAEQRAPAAVRTALGRDVLAWRARAVAD